jgi:hypothetical protein
VAKQKKMIRREHRKGPVPRKVAAAAPRERPRQPVIARPSLILERVEPERAEDALDEVRADLAGVPGESRPWQGSDER